MLDFCVIGGGIVGLATAWQFQRRFTDARIAVLEKEHDVARHQSGRNSGVLHTGIYYKPGSLKATTCRFGKLAMEEFCLQYDVPFERCGKVIVATGEEELAALDRILNRGNENGVQCKIIDSKELRDIEPHARGVSAIHVPEAGIVDYPAVCKRLVDRLRHTGNQVCFDWKVVRIVREKDHVSVRSDRGNVLKSKFLINCAGLYSDHIIKMVGDIPPARIVPFRGEYYELVEHANYLCRNLIYPVPDPNFPFLGVHFTRMVNGGVECGPNAVLALAREGYDWRTIHPTELFDALSYRGFLSLAFRHWQMGLGEIWRSLSKPAFVRALQKLVPEIRDECLKPCRAGVRAQALQPDGSLVDDFLFLIKDRITHVCNAPSPAATASLQIGDHIVTTVEQAFCLHSNI